MKKIPRWMVQGKKKFVGYYKNLADAIVARDKSLGAE